MRRIWAVVLIAVGCFGLAFAVLTPTYGVSHAKRTPLNLDITQISSGPATLLDAKSGELKQVRLRATRKVATDSAASDSKYTTVNESLCIVVIQGPTPNCVPSTDPRLLSVSTDRVTADRRSAEAVNIAKYGENVNGVAVEHQGLSYKWPIDAKKRTYQFYQPDVMKAFPATYEGTAKIAGLTVYKYVSATGDQPYQVQGLFPGTYNDTRTVWIEPRTGVIVNGVEHQVQKIGDARTGYTLALDTTLSFEQSAIDYQANFAKKKIDELRLAQLWSPLIGGVVGVAALAGAWLLLRGRRPTGGDGAGAKRDSTGPAPDDLQGLFSSQT